MLLMFLFAAEYVGYVIIVISPPHAKIFAYKFASRGITNAQRKELKELKICKKFISILNASNSYVIHINDVEAEGDFLSVPVDNSFRNGRTIRFFNA